MDLGLRGEATIMTGASVGLGARELAREGCDVCICARGEEVAWVLEERVAHFGIVHVLVSNAGVSMTKDFLDIERADRERAMESILYAASELICLVIPCMRKQRWGCIITTCSTSSRQPPPPRGVERLEGGAPEVYEILGRSALLAWGETAAAPKRRRMRR